ncbi:hypothetical protein [Arthrobacter sp. B10-11]|uniref:hypothetical protein n=1 Tax=Arthrobacter sp. B10-11 TaxID=3081160 RepID=UPI002953DBC8|nr:hypothetical protein [Arthrobacter sp. B10-11]MDV8147557.1 hypothetical protein [Arthrobacter sp. B10-11]
MALGKDEDEQRLRFEEMLRNADLSPGDLWLRYFSIGGMAGQFEIEAYIHGAIALPALQRDILAHALNERLDELNDPDGRGTYSRGSEDAGRVPEDRSRHEADRPEDESRQDD